MKEGNKSSLCGGVFCGTFFQHTPIGINYYLLFFRMDKTTRGVLFVMLASSLWAIDAVFRTQLTFTIPTTYIVMIEHAIGFLFLSPFLIKDFKSVRSLTGKNWAVLLSMTVVSSVLGTLLFTEALARSFAEFDFVTPLLLQKLQPLFVILLSALFLKEKITPTFLLLAGCAIVGSYLISFGFQPIQFELIGKELVVALALGASLAWGGGTILSKHALKHISFPTLAALRFLLAVPVAFLFSLILGQSYDLRAIEIIQWGRFLIIAGVTGGAFAIFWYYRGLAHIPARLSTIAELMFPVVSVGIAVTSLNPYGEAQVLTVAQIAGIVILIGSILAISFSKKEKDII